MMNLNSTLKNSRNVKGNMNLYNLSKLGSTFLYKHKSKRMHSSRMRTVRCSSRLLGGGWDVCPGVCVPGRVCTPPRLWTQFLTHACETLSFHNFVYVYRFFASVY